MLTVDYEFSHLLFKEISKPNNESVSSMFTFVRSTKDLEDWTFFEDHPVNVRLIPIVQTSFVEDALDSPGEETIKIISLKSIESIDLPLKYEFYCNTGSNDERIKSILERSKLKRNFSEENIDRYRTLSIWRRSWFGSPLSSIFKNRFGNESIHRRKSNASWTKKNWERNFFMQWNLHFVR